MDMTLLIFASSQYVIKINKNMNVVTWYPSYIRRKVTGVLHKPEGVVNLVKLFQSSGFWKVDS